MPPAKISYAFGGRFAVGTASPSAWSLDPPEDCLIRVMNDASLVECRMGMGKVLSGFAPQAPGTVRTPIRSAPGGRGRRSEVQGYSHDVGSLRPVQAT